MTSKERHEARYQRRKAKREKKTIEYLKSLGGFEEVFSYENLYNSFKSCKKGVYWKSSIQNYENRLPLNIYELYKSVNNNTWKSKGFKEFDIMERGKKRHIQSVHISERCLQKCFCDNYLVPAMSRNFIFDNGASLKNKGTEFTLKRLKKHLYDYYRENGNDGYIVIYDFIDYFNSINHDKLFKYADRYFIDCRLKALYKQLVNAFDHGLGLGSQVSQISAVMLPNKLDHAVKDKLAIKQSGRYMDDGYVILKTREKAKEFKELLFKYCKDLGINISDKKVKICKISKTFVFLKKRIFMTSTGKVVIKISKKSISRERRKLKKFYKLYLKRVLTFKEIKQSYGSWRGNAQQYRNRLAVLNMDKLFNELFINKFRKGELIWE